MAEQTNFFSGRRRAAAVAKLFSAATAAAALLALHAAVDAEPTTPRGAPDLKIVLDGARPEADGKPTTTLRVALAAADPEPPSRPDPVKRNGPIFETDTGAPWPKPDLAFVFTGAQDGYIEPCGCAGLDNQLGGLKRRHTMMKQLAVKGWPLAPLDAGGLIKRFGPQALIKYRWAAESLIDLGYLGVGLGVQDLRLDLVGPIVGFEEAKNPITCANVGFFGFDELFSKRYRVAEVAGQRIGFTSVLSDRQAAELGSNADITRLPATQGLREVAPKLAAEGCDQQVLMVYGDGDDARRLSAEFPQFGWVVSAVGADEPPHRSATIEGSNAQLIEVGHKGQYAIVVGVYGKGPGATFRYQKTPLDHRFEDSPQMSRMLTDYQAELKTLGLAALGAKPTPHPLVKPSGGEFAGSAACVDCHEEECDIWEGTGHAHATQSIVDLDPARHFDPECLSCHATGWDPQGYHPFTSGYAGLEKTPHLVGNGCENCHGPAKRHVLVENGDLEVTDAEQEAIYAALHMQIAENEGNKKGQHFGAVVENCMRCHDLDNSPDFDFQEYWPHVKHGGGE